MKKSNINIKHMIELATKELEELRIKHAETGRDRELDYPSISEEEEISLLEDVIDGEESVIEIYNKHLLDTSTCVKCGLTLKSREYCDYCRDFYDHDEIQTVYNPDSIRWKDEQLHKLIIEHVGAI